MSGHCVWTEKQFTNVFYFPCHGQWCPNPIKIDSLHVAFNVHNIHIKSVSVAFNISIVLIQLNLQFSVCDNLLNYLISDGRKLIIWLPWINKTLLFQYQVSGDVVSEKQNKIFFFDKRGKDQNMKSVLANNHKWVQLYTYTVSLMTLIDEVHLNILWQLVSSWRQGCPSWLTSFWLFPQSPWVQKA